LRNISGADVNRDVRHLNDITLVGCALGNGMREHIGDVRIPVTFETTIVECRQKCKNGIDRAFMSLMQSLECCGLLIQLIILAFDLADDGRNDLLLALQGHKLVSEIRQL